MPGAKPIPERVERRARWVLDTLGAGDLRLGEELPYRAEAWDAVERGERPEGDELAEAFFHLARVEEIGGARDERGRFPASASSLDPLDPPLERLRRALGLEPPRYGEARLAVALTHDVDIALRWTRIGILGAAARLRHGALVENGGDSWFFVTADYAFGYALEADTSNFVKSKGGKVLGSVRHPLNSPDFSSFILQAQSSGAKVVGLANAGLATANAIKHAAEFGVTQVGKQRLASLLFTLAEVNGLGLQAAQGLGLTECY